MLHATVTTLMRATRLRRGGAGDAKANATSAMTAASSTLLRPVEKYWLSTAEPPPR